MRGDGRGLQVRVLGVQGAQLFNLSIIFLVMGVIATCIDYFMMHTTSSLPFLLTHFLMNILFVRMAYEVCQAIVNRARNRMPVGGACRRSRRAV